MSKSRKGVNFRETEEQKASRSKMEKVRKQPKNLMHVLDSIER
jgi:hypothetical protein